MNPESRSLENISSRTIALGLEAYGSCMYKSPKGVFYAIINDKEGNVEQYELFDAGNNKVDAKLVRTLKLKGQLEGCVADDIKEIPEKKKTKKEKKESKTESNKIESKSIKNTEKKNKEKK